MLCTALLGLLALCAAGSTPGAGSQDAQAGSELTPPAERRAIAGLGGLASTSTLTLSDPDGKQATRELSVWFVFPERARWQLTEPGGAQGTRVLRYRYGPQTWLLDAGQTESRQLSAAQALEVELEFELRRALWLWPDGFEWSAGAGFRSAPLDVPAARGGTPWFLVARLGQEGRPLELGVAQGSPTEGSRQGPSFRAVVWGEHSGRWFPTACDFHRAGERQWSESVRATYLAPNALDHFFLPPDRKPADVPILTAAPREVRLPARAERRRALAEGSTWEQALAAGSELSQEARTSLEGTGLELAPSLSIELDRRGAARAVRVELLTLPRELPAGWVEVPQTPAWDLRLTGQGPPRPGSLEELRSRLGPSEIADWPFARLTRDARGAARLQLLLPFEREAL